jgi:RNA polymerase sigma factor (TIGR02999 family)
MPIAICRRSQPHRARCGPEPAYSEAVNPVPSEVTQLLKAWRGGDERALERLAPVVESELRRLARLQLSKEGPGHLLQPTALVNELYLRLIDWNAVDWQDRTHFFAVASKIMRRVLVNHAVARRRQKRGGDAVLVSLSEAGGAPDRSEDLLALDEALAALEKIDSRKSRLVELRFFGGLAVSETAAVLGVSERTVHREWDLARAWLFRELNRHRGNP